MDCSYNDFRESVTASATIDSKGDEFVERTCKKIFNGGRHKMHGIQYGVTNLIPKAVALFVL